MLKVGPDGTAAEVEPGAERKAQLVSVLMPDPRPGNEAAAVCDTEPRRNGTTLDSGRMGAESVARLLAGRRKEIDHQTDVR